MSLFSKLLRFARKVVQSVMSGVTQQLNVVEQQARQPIQAMMQQVVGGAWTGRGADAFVQELTSMAVPNVDKITQILTRTNRDINNAIDVMDRADEQVSSIIRGLGDTFGGIF
jgi:uncharacterized protein YukE